MEKSAPKVSRLPLPISDSPLVIDLPDGQKLVVGKMTQGSVIEVATWRGVGRPDSRTSRLMLGMGNGNVNEESEDDESQEGGRARAVRKPEGIAGWLFTAQNILKNLAHINWMATIQSLINTLSSKKPKKLKAKNRKVDQTSGETEHTFQPVEIPAPVSDDADIEAWLNEISEKASRIKAKGSKPAAKKSVSKKAPAKKSSVTKKAAPKSTSKRK